MLTSDFDYALSIELIAQKSIEPRDHARLMVIDREKRTTEDRQFFDIVEYLRPGDLIVWNNSKVFKARLFGALVSSDGQVLRDHEKKIEIFLVRPMENLGVWKVLARPGKHVDAGMKVVFAPDFFCEVMLKEKDGTILVQFAEDEAGVRAKANQYGLIPIPPYVKVEPHELDMYQTVYAKHEGSVAAPTAGFHFTPRLIEEVKKKGIEFAEVTLHVGLGTFLPIKSERVEDHTMHSEWVELSEECVQKINRAKAEGRRVIAVGTTTVRTLEGVVAPQTSGFRFQTSNFTRSRQQSEVRSLKAEVHSYTGDINIFIKPGFEFRVVDAMITNFHLPKSTLLMLVSAFAKDQEFMLSCYRHAVEEQYRFFSFGDAMLIV